MQIPDWLKGTLGGGALTTGVIGILKERSAAKERETDRRFDQIKKVVDAQSAQIVGLQQEINGLRADAEERERILRDEIKGQKTLLLSQARKIGKLQRENEGLRQSNARLTADLNYLHGEVGNFRAISTEVAVLSQEPAGPRT